VLRHVLQTGTLTTNQLNVHSISVPNVGTGELAKLDSFKSIPASLRRALACCHALSVVGPKLVGDEVDLRLFELSGLSLVDDSDAAARPTVNDAVVFTVRSPLVAMPLGFSPVCQSPPAYDHASTWSVLRLLDFSADLARQGSVAVETGSGDDKLLVFVKGAPEVIAGLSTPESVPCYLDAAVSEHAFHGRRVLALAYRSIDCKGQDPGLVAMSLDRCELERDLSFLGIIALENRLKSDSKHVVAELSNASMQPRLVTGDHAATSLSVAKQCGVISPSCSLLLRLQFTSGSRGPMEFVSADDPQRAVYDAESLRSVTNGTWMSADTCDDFANARLVVTGAVFDAIPRQSSLFELVHVVVLCLHA
jgi:cation-transporting P-type ATPase 13A2